LTIIVWTVIYMIAVILMICASDYSNDIRLGLFSCDLNDMRLGLLLTMIIWFVWFEWYTPRIIIDYDCLDCDFCDCCDSNDLRLGLWTV